MAWFGESLSTLTGHLQNLTKEVLSESREEINGTTAELVASRERLEELEALCATQDLEIIALKKQNAELKRVLDAEGITLQEGPSSSQTWLTVEQRCDPAYLAGHRQGKHNRASSDPTLKPPGNHLKELEEKEKLIEYMQIQLRKIEEEKHSLKHAYSELETQVVDLKDQVKSQLKNEVVHDANISSAEVQNLQDKLHEAESTISELECELQKVRQLWLDHISDSQANASELRSDLEQTRKQLLMENGLQRAESLRAHQDLVNRIIQMGEKNREVELNVKKLQAEDKHISADMASIIHKLGDAEQQEILHGTLKALELENQVLNLRNAQLEKYNNELQKVSSDNDKGEDANKLDTGAAEVSDGMFKHEEDIDNLSFHSEFSDASMQKQRLETIVSHLQNQVDLLRHDIRHQEMLRSNWSQEKKDLESQLEKLHSELRSKEDSLALVTAQKGLLSVKTEGKKYSESEDLILKKKLNEANSLLEKRKSDQEQLQLEKSCLANELEAMAKVVQDLESKLGIQEDECASLRSNMEELDTQHQDAIEQLLALKNGLQKEKDVLVLELNEYKRKREVQDAEILTESCCKEMKGVQVENLMEHEVPTGNSTILESKDEMYHKLDEKIQEDIHKQIMSIINFDLPITSTVNEKSKIMYTVKSLIMMCDENKWKKETLERKIAELMKECRDYKSTVECLDVELEKLQSTIVRLTDELNSEKEKGSLPTIHENEELEAMEMKINSLKEENEVLKETRMNLEADAMKIQNERDELASKLRMMEAQQKNEENLQSEIQILYQKVADHENMKQELLVSKSALEVERDLLCKCVEDLKSEKQILNETISGLRSNLEDFNKSRDETNNQVSYLEGEINKLNCAIKHLEISWSNEKLEAEKLKLNYQNLEDELHETLEAKSGLEVQVADLKLSLQSQISEEQVVDLRQQVKETSTENEELRMKLEILKSEYLETENKLKNVADTKVEIVRLQELATAEEEKKQEALKKICELEADIGALKEKSDIDSHNRKDMEQRYVACQDSCKGYIRELESLRSALVSKEEEKGILSGKLLELSSRLAEAEVYKDDLCKVSDKLNTVNDEKKHLLNELEAVNTRCLKWEQENHNLKSELDVKNNNITQLSSEIEKLHSSSNFHHNNVENKSNIFSPFQEENRLEIPLMELRNKVEVLSNLYREMWDLHLSPCPSCHKTQLNSLHWEGRSRDWNLHLQELNNILLSIVHEYRKIYTQNQVHQPDDPKLSCDVIKNSLMHNVEGNLLVSSSEKKCGMQLVDLQQFTPEEKLQYEEKMEVLKSDNTSLQSRLGDSQSRIQSLEKEIRSHQDQDVEYKKLSQSMSILSDTVAIKDVEIQNLMEKNDNLTRLVKEMESKVEASCEMKQTLDQILREREQLVQTVHVKHQECIQYHAEIQRLSSVLSQAMAKNQELSEQYKKLLEEKQAHERDSEQIQHFQNLIMAKDEALVTMGKAIEMKDHECQARGYELESLREQIQCMHAEYISLRSKANEVPQEQNEKLQEDFAKLEESFKAEQQKNKQLEVEVEVHQVKELSMQKELDRLKQHLVEIEDTYTQEVLRIEEETKELQSKLAQAEEVMKSSSTVFKSASIRANQQAETMQEQVRLITQQRDDLQEKLSSAEDEIHKHTASLRNLQAVLEQFQRDKIREINAATDVVYSKVTAAERKHQELLAEISFLKAQLSKANEGLSAGARLGEELDKKSNAILTLKKEIGVLQTKLLQAEEHLKSANSNVEGKIDKFLAKNVMLGYFLAPPNSQSQVLNVVASVLEFNEEEKKRVQSRLGISEGGSGRWFKSLLHPTSGSGEVANQSLSEAFVRFLESESLPQPQLRLLPDNHSASGTSSPNASTRRSSTSSQRQSPLLLAEVQLPTFAQLPVGRNSTSILKDILKES